MALLAASCPAFNRGSFFNISDTPVKLSCPAQRKRCAKPSLTVMRSRQYKTMQPGPPPTLLGRATAAPWYLKGTALVLLATVAVQLLRRAFTRGSLSDVEGRGLIREDRNLQGDPFTDDVLRKMNTVRFDELTEEQITAARKRRSRERDGKVDFEQIVLPENHPFAIKQEVSPEEEELQRRRLAVKRGLPLRDLAGRRGYPGEEPLGSGNLAPSQRQA